MEGVGISDIFPFDDGAKIVEEEQKKIREMANTADPKPNTGQLAVHNAQYEWDEERNKVGLEPWRITVQDAIGHDKLMLKQHIQKSDDAVKLCEKINKVGVVDLQYWVWRS